VPNNGRVWVKDVQGNDVTIKSKPIQFGQMSVIPIDTVLMSGGYFFAGLVRRFEPCLNLLLFSESIRRWASAACTTLSCCLIAADMCAYKNPQHRWDQLHSSPGAATKLEAANCCCLMHWVSGC
jgi:hypothetical protein